MLAPSQAPEQPTHGPEDAASCSLVIVWAKHCCLRAAPQGTTPHLRRRLTKQKLTPSSPTHGLGKS